MTSIFRIVNSRRDLLLELVKRNIFSRYKNTLGGFAWSIVQPLFMLLVYVIAFGYILQIRWPGSEGALEYAFALFAGLIIYNAFSEVLNNSAIVITSNPNFVKKVVFPLEMLPIVTVFTALLHAILSLLVWVFAYTFLIGFPEYTVLLFPVVFLVYFPILLGIAWLASAFGVLIRDSAQFATILGHALLFLSPVFYSIEQTPESIQRILVFNPLTFVIEQLRNILLATSSNEIGELTVFFLFSCLFALISLAIFRKLKPSFADLV